MLFLFSQVEILKEAYLEYDFSNYISANSAINVQDKRPIRDPAGLIREYLDRILIIFSWILLLFPNILFLGIFQNKETIMNLVSLLPLVDLMIPPLKDLVNSNISNAIEKAALNGFLDLLKDVADAYAASLKAV